MEAKLIFEQELIDKIVEKLFERIKPVLTSCGTVKPDDTIFDVKALCEYLAVSEQWVYKQVHEKGIPHLKIRGLLRFRKKSIDKWLNTYNTPEIVSSEKILRVVKKN